MSSYPLADMLTRIRNAIQAGHKEVSVPASTLKHDVLQILQEEGYIKKFRSVEEPGGVRKSFVIRLKYQDDGETSAIEGLEVVSRPGRRIYSGVDEIPKIRRGFGISIVSTPKGVMTDRRARSERVGGEILCSVW